MSQVYNGGFKEGKISPIYMVTGIPTTWIHYRPKQRTVIYSPRLYNLNRQAVKHDQSITIYKRASVCTPVIVFLLWL